ncbi:MAG: transglutaminase-like domain-containing protein [Pseudomonadota bacterium]|uniref:Transglutaminase domain-containing protein n=1 Tax=Candidatus Desulfatibia profunda TaxID=2841695 RepID=A0A8J6NPU8_9BACT|nr:transglutaminase domain-containing protein [Candidatus Desulfatibia profunda]MBL7180494.1 transglutaminase domain-containing protein [Desulfobacterales bacterium]
MLIIFWVMIAAVPVFGENYLLNGGQESQIRYQMMQKIQPSAGIKKLVLSYVVPESFLSPTYNQKITGLDFNFSPPPSTREDRTDQRGNKVIEVTWKAPPGPVKTTIRLTAVNSTKLQVLQTRAPFPLGDLPQQVREYLKATDQVPAGDEQIKSKARELTRAARNEFDAVQTILTWVVDHMHYVLIPQSYDALYSFHSGKGNCQNYSHLAAALMRASGIPVRIVNGITLKQPYDIDLKDSILTMKMAQGRHSWIEVYFPDLGWVPFDPQGTELFVSNRFIRVEAGLDNNETRQDGLMRWVQAANASGRPLFEESIDAEFASDRIKLSARKTNYGPRGLLLCPQVEAAFLKITAGPPPAPPQRVPEEVLKRLRFTVPYVFGNLDFPENIDFLSARGPAEQSSENTMELRKNFLVETAEYVTTQGNQYAQTFILTQPMQLQQVGLALHKFNSEGQLWLELFKDDGGIPGDIIATSDIKDLGRMKFMPGYAWVDFDFTNAAVILSPGRYWVALGFTGSPIVNWFFTYGKPVGPQDGTRYKTIFDETWSRSLAYEFNYRVTGLTAKQKDSID